MKDEMRHQSDVIERSSVENGQIEITTALEIVTERVNEFKKKDNRLFELLKYYAN